MSSRQKHSGFSLTEVLLAVGILAVGMVFIAGVFPAGIYFTTVATERSIAAVAADEAFAKIEICGVDLNKLNLSGLKNFKDVLPLMVNIVDPDGFTYPSDPGIDISQKQYYWSALCRRTDPFSNLVQVTVFVSRKVSPNLKYPAPGGSGISDWPVPVKVGVSGKKGDNELKIANSSEISFINDGYTIVDDATGRIYRVLRRYRGETNKILLDRKLDAPTNRVWVVPPPVSGGRYPCMAVYQRVISFN